ncbi:hypothetical protein [Pseudomonas sp. CMR5c]|uniref:hypothetical protein n=1 Tax=Pseudomonas sp. CMR5c TaxID=658630 RepID=UPI00069EFDB1|nr:hypothetical protein [Pseudomonas sp. CMR5c]AZC19565.1 hypothetical protein C4K40_4184 [Pseudomonas sp. CMR5c]
MHLGDRVHWENNRSKKMPSTYKRGSQINVGDMIYVGMSGRVAAVREFKPHPGWPSLPNLSGRVAITQSGSITIVDQDPIRVPT